MQAHQDPQGQPALQPPVSEQDHIQGNIHAPVILVEYGDFECPYCGKAYPAVKELQKRLGDRLCFVYRHFPLPQHPHAEHAAEAAEAAGAQGKFWEMHDYLFEHQQNLSDRDLLDDAQALGLDTGRFTSEMEQGTYANQIKEDLENGELSDVAGTPTFFINGTNPTNAYDFKTLLAAIENASPVR
jgi:protein-disulfide isomerase